VIKLEPPEKKARRTRRRDPVLRVEERSTTKADDDLNFEATERHGCGLEFTLSVVV
jgi:hypothetical protein